VLGNHDHELVEITGKYPLGRSSVNIVEDEYATSKGAKKLTFLHGHQFDKKFPIPSWRIMPLFNNVAMVLDKFTQFFVLLFAADIIGVGLTQIWWIRRLDHSCYTGSNSDPFLGGRIWEGSLEPVQINKIQA